jgi:hypothetical protein
MTKPNAKFRRLPIFIFLCAVFFNPISSKALPPRNPLPCSGVGCVLTPTPITYNDVTYFLLGSTIGMSGAYYYGNAVDKYDVTCPLETKSLQALVNDAPPYSPAQLSVQLSKAKSTALKSPWVTSVLQSDPYDSDGKYSSPSILAMNSGSYRISILKTGTGSESYSFIFRCVDSLGHERSPDLVITRQDQ